MKVEYKRGVNDDRFSMRGLVAKNNNQLVALFLPDQASHDDLNLVSIIDSSVKCH